MKQLAIAATADGDLPRAALALEPKSGWRKVPDILTGLFFGVARTTEQAHREHWRATRPALSLKQKEKL